MRKYILLLLTSILLTVACKSQNIKKKNATTASFFAYYNTLFNSKQALEKELSDRNKNYKDDFYAPYIQILKFDKQEIIEDTFGADYFRESNTPSSHQSSKAPTLDIVETKAIKAIEKYSVQKGGVEKNKEIFNAHLLLAQARLYKEKYYEALDALDYIFTKMSDDKRIDLAKIYQGYIYSKVQDYNRAEEIFSELKSKKLKKEYKRLFSIYYAEMLLAAGKKEQAVEELEEAFINNKNREIKSRIAFLRGQILTNLGRNKEARESFAAAYKYSNDFEFEVKSQVELAKTFSEKDNYEEAKKYIENIGKKGTYGSRKNEFYYALGLTANKAGKYDEAQEYFRKATKEKISDPQVRGLTFYEIGKFYLDRNDYISAGAYYDSALAVMNYEPTKVELSKATKSIKDISKNYYLIKKNDSILALTKMSEAEKNTFFSKYINSLKEKEQKLKLEKRRAERNKVFDNTDYTSNSIFAKTGNSSTFQDFSTNTGKNTFYFANQNNISRGQSEFKKIWGNRSLVDNWRFSAQTSSIQDVKNESMGTSSAPNPRRFEVLYYIEQLPTETSEIYSLKKARDTASLGLGRMYKDYFNNKVLATKTLYDLVEQNPENEVKLQALYRIFSMNYENNPKDAERAKQIILTEFPNTSYAEFVKNPKSNNFSKKSSETEKLYKQAFDLYKENQFEKSKEIIAQAIQNYPKDGLIPKFELLDAFNSGKTAGKEVMILQLKQIALNYEKTDEGIKAKKLLKYLKSDLDLDEENSSQKSIENQINSNSDFENDMSNVKETENNQQHNNLPNSKKPNSNNYIPIDSDQVLLPRENSKKSK